MCSRTIVARPRPALRGLAAARLLAAAAFFACGGLAVSRPAPAEEGAESAAAARLTNDARYLASDELEGRGVGTAGLAKAADYIADEFRKAGLRVDAVDGQAFQKFTIPAAVERGPAERNTLVLVGPPAAAGGEPQRVTLTLEKDFQSLALGGAGKFDAPLAFVGYGIQSKEPAYDDFAGVDVKGKIVVIIRKEPQQDKEDSAFNGRQPSQHAPFTRKIANAAERGAAAVILVNDLFSIRQSRVAAENAWKESVAKLVSAHQDYSAKPTPTAEETAAYRKEVARMAEQIRLNQEKLDGDFDAVPGFLEAGQGSSAKVMPVLFCKRAALAETLKSAGVDLDAVEQEIDRDLQPRSRELAGWRGVGETDVQHRRADVHNVIGVLEGEGPLAQETIVIGAHYDHVGKGGPGSGSLAPSWNVDVHNGADDNASGTASLLEAARYFGSQPQKPRRRLVFIAFTGEERGLLGSAHYVKNPRFPLESTIAMVNMDMVGRLLDNKLIVYGTGTATEFNPLLDRLNEQHKFLLTKQPEGFGPSDHASFYGKQIPVFHFFTGTHPDYHRPSDDAERLNIDGLRRITALVCDTVKAIDAADKRPEYKEVKGSAQIARSGDRPYFGSIPDFAEGVEGYALMGVTKGSPADRAGLKAGDVIVKLGDSRVANLDDFDLALRKFKAGDKAPVTVKRGNETLTLTVTLDPAK
ncbi:MAG: M20/M25/M40 family metallo-hydrolase [Pirellulales bacterium]